MSNYVFMAAGSLIGGIITIVIFVIVCGKGTLKIDHSDPEKDIYRIELRTDPDLICKKKYFLMRVDNNASLINNPRN